ncbi:MAG: hypothetical protein PHP58_06090, partial [Eubacteriales bacterium]|nr:hypothetical protein [Eubacteriales bacterium]
MSLSLYKYRHFIIPAAAGQRGYPRKRTIVCAIINKATGFAAGCLTKSEKGFPPLGISGPEA